MACPIIRYNNPVFVVSVVFVRLLVLFLFVLTHFHPLARIALSFFFLRIVAYSHPLLSVAYSHPFPQNPSMKLLALFPAALVLANLFNFGGVVDARADPEPNPIPIPKAFAKARPQPLFFLHPTIMAALARARNKN
ncbi:hypothetical protein GQ42DRAFT_93670 [Ramicandelaber brevisporus]|nr:hypothetical protein GQ42DRAFT_93670 [Ramicandelaber brevisporus]